VRRILARDDQRPRPPITLPGPPRAGTPTKISGTPSPTPIPRVRDSGEMGRRADRFEKAKAQTSEPGDWRDGAWSREQLERMNAQFCRRLTRAIGRGLEHAP
jgi:hypothetical protein